MENPEEVLQALDEFQKLRPADIPKELEEYLSWVAKTGDPVYQWPLIKALFREKLLRVMTEFYESCPTLELAPCPNVEQFNYDIMKSALLDRLESFANAPFTVQRICELLTAPRKEYNRVDKFMRAIEKNILVVSTREPGPTARRSENGDGMVNGSSEDNGSRSPYDMDLWARACTLATTVTVQTVETHSTIVNIHHLPSNIIPATELTIVKNSPSIEAFPPYGTEPDLCDAEMATKNQDLPSTFTPSTSEIASIANLTSQIQPQDLNPTSGIQNLSNMVPEPANIVGDVPEAIMNEDTNSQPSLDLENNDNEPFDSTRKLQTTFQSSDFITHGIKSQKFYSDDSKPLEKTIVEAEFLRTDLGPLIELDQKVTVDNTDATAINAESKTLAENGELTTPATIITANSIEMTENVVKMVVAEPSIQNAASIVENSQTIDRNISNEATCVNPDTENTTLLKNGTESALLDLNTEKDDLSCVKVDSSKKETQIAEAALISVAAEPIVSHMVNSSQNAAKNIMVSEETGSVTDSKNLNTSAGESDEMKVAPQPEDSENKELNKISESIECMEEDNKVSEHPEQSSTTIEEISCDTVENVTKSIVPDPLPIIEEPKDEEPAPKSEAKLLIVDATEEKQNKSLPPLRESEEVIGDTDKISEPTKPDLKIADVESNEPFSIEDSSIVKSSESSKDLSSAESMEIDSTEGSQTCHQDEPMEEGVSDIDKS
ncbi:uncharacterized protein LOC105686443 [Athalia rosae]|uniref:uncharacterized protein LOC105686443 n=1 Tax=Athalia rosae TaxID=37344 RepID=UPI002033C71F|nr:uncharacterized protein LOC105686443 [Athalia rosae]